MRALSAELDSLNNEVQMIRKQYPYLEPHSQSADMEMEEVVEFANLAEAPSVGVDGSVDEVAEDLYSSDNELKTFLSRPARIQSFVIAQGEGFNYRRFRPWRNFFDHAPIKKKLDNYSYIQCDLKIKFVVNSTPFIYGLYAASYQPLTDFGTQHDVTVDVHEVDRLRLTQRPTVFIEPHKNLGGEMTLPFFYHKNWLPLTASSADHMGLIDLYPIKSLESANGLASGPVTVLVYAWAENVKLVGNTINLAMQSKDEYAVGPISRVASAVAGVSSRLQDAPIIGKFAKATTLGATAAGSIAALFGFTNPPVVQNSVPMKNQPFHAMASSQISAPIDKLTLDPKCELTVDPTIAGLKAEDELAIAYISRKSGMLRMNSWSQTDTTDYSLFRCNVCPTLCRTIGSAPTQSYVDLPMGYVARLFTAWRGDIVIRIVLIKSQYHQGRLRVTYDPTGNIFGTSDSEAVTINKIVDIETSDYLEFTIPYMAPQSWLNVKDNVARDNSSPTDSDSPYDSNFHNGRFEVRVLNPLTGPDTSADVGLAIFACAGENFELANPRSIPVISSVFQNQSADMTWEEFTMGSATSRPANLMAVNYGEDIRSLRTLLRRFCLHEAVGYPFKETSGITFSAAMIGRVARNIYPIDYGYDTGGVSTLTKHNSASGQTGNNTKITPYTYMVVCFVGQRGSMNYSYNRVDEVSSTALTVHRVNGPPGFTSDTQIITYSSGTFSNVLNPLNSGLAGLSLQNERTQTGLQFNVPFMNRYRFASTTPTNRKAGLSIDDTDHNNFVVSAYNVIAVTASTEFHRGTGVHEYHAIGPDYTPLWFLSTPRRWIYTEIAQ